MVAIWCLRNVSSATITRTRIVKITTIVVGSQTIRLEKAKYEIPPKLLRAIQEMYSEHKSVHLQSCSSTDKNDIISSPTSGHLSTWIAVHDTNYKSSKDGFTSAFSLMTYWLLYHSDRQTLLNIVHYMYPLFIIIV